MGGFATWNLVEDFTTSYEIFEPGWRSIYYPLCPVPGAGPRHLARCLPPAFPMVPGHHASLLLGHPPVEKGSLLGPRRRIFSSSCSATWPVALAFPVFFIAIPLLVYRRGQSCFLQGYELPYGVLRLAYLAATILMFYFLFSQKEPLRQFKMLCSLFPVHALAIGAALLYPPGRKPAP